MINTLPQTYKLATINPLNQETFDNRTKSIKRILEEEGIEWFLDCIRLFYVIPSNDKEFLKRFSKFFNDDDPFYDNSNTIENQILASAVLGQYLIDEGSDSAKIALAIKSAYFGKKLESFQIKLIEQVDNYFETQAIGIRQVKNLNEYEAFPSFKEDSDSEESNSKYLKTASQYFSHLIQEITNNQNLLLEKINALEEESNIQWWLFREYSDLAKKEIRNIDLVVAPFYLAKEINDLIQYNPPPNSSVQFLRKALSFLPKNDKCFSVKESITSLASMTKDFTQDSKRSIELSNLTPLSLAYRKAVEGEGEFVVKHFETLTKISSLEQFSSIEFGSQYLLECSLFDAY
jgi:hypothetical protein